MAPPTILFTAEAAEEQDETYVHSLGLNGLLELIGLDPSLASYERSLFAESMLQYSRRMKTDEENQKLDRTIEGFLGVLSRHFLSHAAQKALEFLLRHYRIHRHNSAALVRCILPFHGTRLFVRVAALLRGGDEKAGWLRAAGGERMSVPPPRTLLVQRAAKEVPLLEHLHALGSAHAVASSFSAVAMLEMAAELSFLGGKEAQLLRTLLEHARQGLTADAAAERRLAGMLLLVQLSCRGSLAAEPARLLAELVGARLRQADSAAEARDCLQCLIVLHRLPPLAAVANKNTGAGAAWPPLVTDVDPTDAATKATLSAVSDLCTRCDASALLRPLLLQLYEAKDAAPDAAARAVLALPVRSLARPVAALLASLEAVRLTNLYV